MEFADTGMRPAPVSLSTFQDLDVFTKRKALGAVVSNQGCRWLQLQLSVACPNEVPRLKKCAPYKVSLSQADDLTNLSVLPR